MYLDQSFIFKIPLSKHSLKKAVPGYGVAIEKTTKSGLSFLAKSIVLFIVSSVSPGNPRAKLAIILIPSFLHHSKTLITLHNVKVFPIFLRMNSTPDSTPKNNVEQPDFFILIKV